MRHDKILKVIGPMARVMEGLDNAEQLEAMMTYALMVMIEICDADEALVGELVEVFVARLRRNVKPLLESRVVLQSMGAQHH